MGSQRKKGDNQSPPAGADAQNTGDSTNNKTLDQSKQKSKQQTPGDQGGQQPKLCNQLPVKITSERFNCITKFAFATSVGHQPGNPNKPNQDAYVLVPNMLGQLGLHFFSVCDGHGINGHHVSAYIKENLPRKCFLLFSFSLKNLFLYSLHREAAGSGQALQVEHSTLRVL